MTTASPTLDELYTLVIQQKNRITDLELRLNAHAPVDGAAGGDYPHPRSQVDVTVYGDGKMQLSPAGIQLESDLGGAYLPVIAWLNDLVNTAIELSNAYPKAVIEGFTTDAPTADMRMVAATSADIQSFIQLTEGQAILNADDAGIAATQITLNCSAVSGRRILISNAPVIFAYWTTDPTDGLGAVDGALIYRTDTDKFRARVNGAWVNLIDSGDATWVDLTDGGATTLHTHAGGAGVATDTIWDAKGDLAVGTGADTAAKLSSGGVDGQTLQVKTGAATGLQWVGQGATPTTQALGDAAAAGAAGEGVPSINHVHGMPAAATQAEMEAGASLTAVVTPGRTHFHPGVAKVWVQGTPNSTTIISSYNVTSLGDTATGQQTVTIATDFSSTAYNVQVTIGDTSTLLAQSGTVMSKAAGSYVMNSVIEAGSGDDPSTDWNSVGFGDQ